MKLILPFIREHYRKPNISPSARMFLLQLVGAFAVLYGISFWSIPCALIIGGACAVVGTERQGQQSRERRESPEEMLAIQARIKTALASGEDPFAQPGVPLTQEWVSYAVSLRRRGVNAL